MNRRTKTPKIEWVYPGILARSCRPCYHDCTPTRLGVYLWLNRAKQLGIRSILCLLADDELREYFNANGLILLGCYRRQGFQVAHIPVPDHLDPPLRLQDMALIRTALRELEAPLLIHCGAGIDRTGTAVQFIKTGIGHGPCKVSTLIAAEAFLNRIHPPTQPTK